MKKVFKTICAITMVAVMASCGGNSGANENANEKDCQSKAECPQEDCCKAACDSSNCSENAPSVDLSKKYVCPNNDFSSDEPGVCPNEDCGMELIER